MKTIEVNNLTDKQFEMYLDLLKEIRNKFQEESLITDSDWNEYQVDYLNINLSSLDFKKVKLDVILENEYFSLQEFIIFENENPVAWIALKRLTGERYEFICDSIYGIFPKSILTAISEIVSEYLTKSEADKIEFFTKDKRKQETFKNEGFEISHTSTHSKLNKEDMDFGNMERIIDNNNYVKNYELRLMNEFPEDLYDEFTEVMNDVNQESVVFRPEKRKVKVFTKESLLNLIKNDKEDGDPMYMYVIIDKNKIAAFCRVYMEKDFGNFFIQHCGGLTGVGKNYRGKGFARFLKAKMYLKIKEDYPDFKYALTDTYEWNKYMYRINEEFGFKPVQKGITFTFSRDSLNKYLNQ